MTIEVFYSNTGKTVKYQADMIESCPSGGFVASTDNPPSFRLLDPNEKGNKKSIKITNDPVITA